MNNGLLQDISASSQTKSDYGRRDFLSKSMMALAGGFSTAEAMLTEIGEARAQDPRQPTLSTANVVASFFPGFRQTQIETSGAIINVLTGGSGAPLLLMHGYPQTLVEWHRIAPQLAQRFSVVLTDLRGYGDSSKPPDGENHFGYSKRAMALDQVEVMERLGFRQFAVVGHDRGGRVGHRMAIDHRDRITKLAVLDIVPTLRMYQTTDKVFATTYFHWFFLIQPAPFPETLINCNIEAWLRLKNVPFIAPEAYSEYLRCFRDPATLHASCEDYRAAASIDLEHDAADLAGCGKSRDFEKMAMERARYRNEGHIRSMAYGRAPGDEWQRNDDQSTFSASC
jgi:haloacetate dehalogenase